MCRGAYTRTHTSAFERTHTSAFGCTSIYSSLRMHLWYICIQVYVCVNVCACVCMCMCVCVRASARSLRLGIIKQVKHTVQMLASWFSRYLHACSLARSIPQHHD